MPPGDKGPLELINEAKKAKELAIWVKTEYGKCKEARSATEKQWHLNMSFYYGKQYVQVLTGMQSGVNGKLYTPPAPPWRTRLVINRIRPVIRTELSRVTSQKPNASVVPASSEDEDLFAAQAAEQIWESIYRNKKINREFRRAAFWMLITGNGFIKDWWDKDAIDPNNKDQPGDIAVCPVTPFHLFVPDLREEELEKQLYVIHAYTRPVEVVKQQYAAVLGGINLKGSVVSHNEIIDDAQLNLATGSKKAEDVLCYEMWLKPGAHVDFPLGGLVQVVDTYIVNVVNTGIPYQHGEFPFTHFTHVPSGKFYATSVVEDVISLQQEYNRTRSQIVESQNRMAKPQLMAPKGSVDASKITTEPGIVIEYRPGMAPPQPLPLQGIPPYVLQGMDRVLSDIEDITSQHQVSKGNVPTGVTAATAISYLQERDDSTMSPTYDSVEEGMEKLARHILSHVVQYWDTERTVKVVGDDASFDTLVLKGSKIANGQDIRMEGGSALPISKAARQAFIMDLMKMGMIPPDQGLRIMEIGGVQKLYDELQVDQRQARRENLKMKLLDENMILQWEQQREMAAQFSSQMQQLGSDPVAQGLPSDFPALPPDFAGQGPGQPVGGAPAPSEGPPGGMDPAADPMAGPPQPDPNTPVSNPNGSIQGGGNVDPQSGLPMDMPLLVPVNTWDNHAVHIEVHNSFRKGQAFERLPDATKRLFEEHVALHSMSLNSAAMAASMQGIPPEALDGSSAPGGGSEAPPAESGSNQFSPPTGG